jgi:hypothetical protein
MSRPEHKNVKVQERKDYEKSFTHSNPKPTTKPPLSDGRSTGAGKQNQSSQGDQSQKSK